MPITSLITSATQGPATQSYRHLEQGAPKRLDAPESEQPIGPSDPTSGSSFMDLVKGFVGDVNAMQLQAGQTIDAFAAGEITDVHQVMVATQEAGLALDLLLEIRNRTQDAFQEIMRMQV